MPLKVGDTALAQHGVMIYEAKILKIDDGSGVKSNLGDMASEEGKNTQYFVHYQGWAKKWDEWVLKENVYEDTKENRLLQQKAKENLEKDKKEKKNNKKNLKKIGVNGIIETSRNKKNTKSPFKRLKIDEEKETEEVPDDVKQVQIPMPFQLKKQLVDDWKWITQEPHQLVPLPRTPNVSQIIKNYLEFQLQKYQNDKEKQEYKVV
jgi:mortality factor 4-like protein 1